MLAVSSMLVLLCLVRLSVASVDEYRLLQYLKENYDYFERPVENSSKALDVKVRFLLNQIIDVSREYSFMIDCVFGTNYTLVLRTTPFSILIGHCTDEKNQVMTILAYVDYRWSDYKLQWDPSRFGGIRDVRFGAGDDAPFKLWKPDVLLFNSVSESFDSTYASRLIVNYNGEVQQNPPGIFRFICKVDVTYYPFDTQTCYLKLGSWTYSGSYINLDFVIQDIVGVKGNMVNAERIENKDSPGSYYVNESIDLQVYLPNGEWDLMNTPGKRVVTIFGEESYHELYYYIHVRRRTLAYGINLIIPSLVISMMTVLGFTLPPEAGEKLTLETTILLSVIFFIQMVSNMSPPQSKSVPILAAFFSCCLMVVSCSCVFTVLVLSLRQRKPESGKMGPLMRKVFIDWLPYILLMGRPNHPLAPKTKVISKSVLPVHRLSTFIPMLNLPRPSQTAIPLKIHEGKATRSVNPELKYLRDFCDDLELIHKELAKMTERVEEKRRDDMIVSEWRFAAMAVDRMCLYLFSLFITVSTCGIILPHIIEGLQDSPH